MSAQTVSAEDELAMYVIVTIAGNILHVYGYWDTRYKAMAEMTKMRTTDQEEYPRSPRILMFVRKVITEPPSEKGEPTHGEGS